MKITINDNRKVKRGSIRAVGEHIYTAVPKDGCGEEIIVYCSKYDGLYIMFTDTGIGTLVDDCFEEAYILTQDLTKITTLTLDIGL